MRNIVCIGGSTGALDALRKLVRRLPADLPAAVFVVRHITSDNSGLLAEILRPICALPVVEASHGQPIEPGRITIAPANHHLILDRTHVRLVAGPKENWARPAIDPLFRSAAQHHGAYVIGIVLSGKLDDGMAGLWSIKRRGGLAVVQDPTEAEAPDMPSHALTAVAVDVVERADQIGTLLPAWCRQETGSAPSGPVRRTLEVENACLERREVQFEALDEVGKRVPVVCPECGGQLWQMNDGPPRYRCHVGHAQSAQTLLAQQRQQVEAAGWQLIRAIEEDDHLCVQLLENRLPSAQESALATRIAHNRTMLERLKPIVAAQIETAASVTPTDRQGIGAISAATLSKSPT